MGQYFIGPSTGSVRDDGGAARRWHAVVEIVQLPCRAVTLCTEKFRRHTKFCTERLCRAHHCARKRRVVRLRIVVAKHRLQAAGVEPIEFAPLRTGYAREAIIGCEPAQHRVQGKTSGNLPRSATSMWIDRNKERYEPYQFRRRS